MSDGEVKAAYLVNHIPGLTLSQIAHWVNSGWLEPLRGEAYGPYTMKMFTRREYMKAKYMAFLVHKMGFTPNAASDIADIALRGRKHREKIWVEYKDAVIGIPEIKDQI